jgi:hypothetical protein
LTAADGLSFDVFDERVLHCGEYITCEAFFYLLKARTHLPHHISDIRRREDLCARMHRAPIHSDDATNDQMKVFAILHPFMSACGNDDTQIRECSRRKNVDSYCTIVGRIGDGCPDTADLLNRIRSARSDIGLGGVSVDHARTLRGSTSDYDWNNGGGEHRPQFHAPAGFDSQASGID